MTVEVLELYRKWLIDVYGCVEAIEKDELTPYDIADAYADGFAAGIEYQKKKGSD